MTDALVFANETGLTAYDASYAVLARNLQVPLITAEEWILQRVDWALRL